MKKLLALGVVAVILFISMATFSIVNLLLKNSSFGASMYENYGAIGSVIYTCIELSPLIIGIWLIRFSWKKITAKKVEEQ